MVRAAKKEVIELNPEEIPEIIKAVKESLLPEKFKEIILVLVQRMVDIKQTAREKAAALEKIKRMFCNQTEKVLDEKKANPENKPGGKKKNHGRNGVEDYKISREVDYPHTLLEAGQECPRCAHGTLHEMEPRKIIRLIGQPGIVAELHKPSRLRCSGCGEILTADLPKDIGEEKADATANSLVALFRYGMGLPNWRLAKLQEAMGVPLPASTQWEMTEMLWLDAAPAYQELLSQAANFCLFYADDTKGRVLSLMKDKEERKERGERVGIYTTGIIAHKEGREIHLFFTGPRYAGENMDRLLEKRDPALPTPMQMSDASSMSPPKEHAIILLLCLIHARREFVDGYKQFPDECSFVIDRIGTVYHHERQSKEEGMTPNQRLLYHQQLSAPIMEEIKTYAQRKLETHEVEPNSVLGGAFNYMLTHWHGLTQFLRIAGAPLDSNTVERLIKKAIQHRKNSLFYKTENGAKIGDALMSLIQTTIAAKENPFEYLTALQKNSRHVAKNPKLWLPWNYKNTMKSVEQPEPG